jgi:hypothetical protein
MLKERSGEETVLTVPLWLPSAIPRIITSDEPAVVNVKLQVVEEIEQVPVADPSTARLP